ncbi:MAG: DUF1847 domain-containing protein, partial [Planctomycetes bacterium]|nr:DUF1847 domain-containing protein [Planctomycetota bacterium]
MKYGIPLWGRRVAPRITTAESILLVTTSNDRIISKETMPLESPGWIDLSKLLASLQVHVLVCGGIDRKSKNDLQATTLKIIDNVASDMDGVLEAIETRSLIPGYGFKNLPERPIKPDENCEGIDRANPSSLVQAESDRSLFSKINCIDCKDRACFQGRACPLLEGRSIPGPDDASARLMLEASMDISLEEERTLCRISELVYFCLEMEYRKIGIAFCADLLEPAEILTRLLRRYFEVHPVVCKAGGGLVIEPISNGDENHEIKKSPRPACNPLGQAEILNLLETDLNVMVGLCMGVDCIFSRAS